LDVIISKTKEKRTGWLYWAALFFERWLKKGITIPREEKAYSKAGSYVSMPFDFMKVIYT